MCNKSEMFAKAFAPELVFKEKSIFLDTKQQTDRQLRLFWLITGWTD